MWTKNIDKKLIILQVIYENYEKNNKVEFRYSRLKEECEDRLEALEYKGSYGGSFERYLKKLEADDVLRRISKGKKDTIFVADIKKIQYLVELQRLDRSFQTIDKKITDQSLEDAFLEEAIEEAFSSTLDNRVNKKYGIMHDSSSKQESSPYQSYLPIKEFIARLMANMMSRLFYINIKCSESNFPSNRESISAILKPLIEVVQSNPAEPFKITFEYNGMPTTTFLDKIRAISIFEPAISRIMAEPFVKWAKAACDYEVQEEDKRKIAEGNFSRHSLSDPAVYDHLEIFENSVNHYTNLLLSAN